MQKKNKKRQWTCEQASTRARNITSFPSIFNRGTSGQFCVLPQNCLQGGGLSAFVLISSLIHLRIVHTCTLHTCKKKKKKKSYELVNKQAPRAKSITQQLRGTSGQFCVLPQNCLQGGGLSAFVLISNLIHLCNMHTRRCML